ncbi:MAG: DUF488 domain-containing protein [Gordonia sp. (in: high G+C Gram-positive bacteria)]|uniref:DUF488 family protein, N3 subclade n=1 Tax=Gordonia sp. (in: high G+C Gram-positive bacteria) TaxID=84139 RepID=UPI0039E2410B
MLEVATIGVYGFTGESFLRCLADTQIKLVIDVRQRRGVRGPAYTWANSKRLQAALTDAGIGYAHHRELAPTTELRQLQYAEDDRQGVGKRSRRELAESYRLRYTTEVLDRADLSPVLTAARRSGPTALLCVERDAPACHRSLIAQRLADQHGIVVVNLGPD